jgi:chromosome segregation ATPase
MISLIAVGMLMSAGGATFVDIEAANKEITELEGKNGELQKSIDELKQQNAELAARNSELEGFIREANIILAEFQKSNGDLHDLYSTVSDAEQKRSLNEKMVASRKKQTELETKKQSWVDEIRANNDTVIRNKRLIGMKENTLKKNLNRIEFLKASIEMSQGEGTSLDAAFTKADEVRGKADQLLSR